VKKSSKFEFLNAEKTGDSQDSPARNGVAGGGCLPSILWALSLDSSSNRVCKIEFERRIKNKI
jgi:hypothetical protein